MENKCNLIKLVAKYPETITFQIAKMGVASFEMIFEKKTNLRVANIEESPNKCGYEIWLDYDYEDLNEKQKKAIEDMGLIIK